MNRTIPSIISFIILIQRKYVLINSAKSLFMRVRSKGFRPDTFKPKKRKWKRAQSENLGDCVKILIFAS